MKSLFYLQYLHNSISHSIIISNRTTAELKSQVQQSGKFESLSESGTRPTQIIEKYELLYTQGRLDAMDDLDQIAGLSKYGKHQEMKQKILYGIMVVCSLLPSLFTTLVNYHKNCQSLNMIHLKIKLENGVCVINPKFETKCLLLANKKRDPKILF